MKTKYVQAFGLSVAVGGLVLGAGCVVLPNGQVGVMTPQVYVAPPVVVAPAPVVVEGPVMVPDSYVWDGVEYVGVVGDQYFYLGAGNVWLVCDPFRLERFHGWERGHADWRAHAIRNDRFRTDRNGHVQPRRDGPDRKAAPKRQDDHH
jgi:hypothetical protein